MAFFSLGDPRHMAVARALCDGLDYGPYEGLNHNMRPIIQDLAERVITAVAPLSWLNVNHRQLSVCPGCGAGGLSTTGLVDLGYEFVVCECGTPDYPHLVEQMWHRNHMGRDRETIAATTRRDTLAEAVKMLTGAAHADRPGGRTSLTYEGGLRRASRLVRQMLDDSPTAAEGTDRS